ncbi:MAG TPA: archaemetzincin, partial [Polyangia bacterium]|nr:archaemetzincin [Polyangia bacterium]
ATGLAAVLLLVCACGNGGVPVREPVAKGPEDRAPAEVPAVAVVAPEVAPDAASVEPGPRVFVLALMPLGEVDEEAVRTARGSIELTYGWEVRLLEAQGLLASAWHEPRKRYRAEKLLSWLRGRKPADADRIMGLTAADISTTKGRHQDWGICGLADLGGDAAVVSTYRIGRKLEKYPNAERHERYLTRLADLTAHEFGHQLGLPHCPTAGCTMEDAAGTVLTFNRSSGHLCDLCVAELRRLGWPMTAIATRLAN